MKTSKLVFSLILATSASIASAKPPPKAASDVNCIECVDTADIAPEAVTEEKLSADLKNKLGQAAKSVVVLDANDKQVGTIFDARGNGATVILDNAGQLYSLGVRGDGYYQGDFAYTQPGCLGIPIIYSSINISAPTAPSMITGVRVRGNQGYIRSGIIPADTEVIYSLWTDGFASAPDGVWGCEDVPPTAIQDIPDVEGEYAAPYDLSVFTPPFRYALSP